MIRFAGHVIEVKKLFPNAENKRFVKVSQMEEENEVMSQEEAIAKFMPEIESNGTDFEKFTQIKARPARQGEMIETITADGKETMNQAQEGDFVVSNLGGSGEEYILSGDKLAKRYKEVGNGIYQATGECRGITYSGPETSLWEKCIELLDKSSNQLTDLLKTNSRYGLQNLIFRNIDFLS